MLIWDRSDNMLDMTNEYIMEELTKFEWELVKSALDTKIFILKEYMPEKEDVEHPAKEYERLLLKICEDDC